MTNAEYMVDKMVEHLGKWSVDVNEKGVLVIRNHNGTCLGVKEPDGTIVTAEELIKRCIEKIKIEA